MNSSSSDVSDPDFPSPPPSDSDPSDPSDTNDKVATERSDVTSALTKTILAHVNEYSRETLETKYAALTAASDPMDPTDPVFFRSRWTKMIELIAGSNEMNGAAQLCETYQVDRLHEFVLLSQLVRYEIEDDAECIPEDEYTILGLNYIEPLIIRFLLGMNEARVKLIPERILN